MQSIRSTRHNALRSNAAGLRAPSRAFLHGQQLPRKTRLCAARQQAGSCTAGCLRALRLWCAVCCCYSSFFLRSNLTRTNTVAGVCTDLAARLCAGNDVFVLMHFLPACSGPQFLLPFLSTGSCSPVPFTNNRLGLH